MPHFPVPLFHYIVFNFVSLCSPVYIHNCVCFFVVTVFTYIGSLPSVFDCVHLAVYSKTVLSVFVCLVVPIFTHAL